MTLAMSVLAGVLTISSFSSRYGKSPAEAAAVLQAGLPGYGQYDYGEGLDLVRELDWVARDPVDDSWHARLFILVDHVVTVRPPGWRGLVPYGRKFALEEMDPETLRCLRDVGLLEDTEGARQWWDKIAEEERQLDRLRRNETGRSGELLSIELERQSLIDAGHADIAPAWAALDDNTLGYDILSWWISDDGVAHRKTIEVKASRSSPVLIHISRQQCNFALSTPRHEFHVWDISRQRVRIMRSDEVTRHAPSDQADGRWSEFTLTVDV